MITVPTFFQYRNTGPTIAWNTIAWNRKLDIVWNRKMGDLTIDIAWNIIVWNRRDFTYDIAWNK
jgi:hypothetical protein